MELMPAACKPSCALGEVISSAVYSQQNKLLTAGNCSSLGQQATAVTISNGSWLLSLQTMTYYSQILFQQSKPTCKQ